MIATTNISSNGAITLDLRRPGLIETVYPKMKPCSLEEIPGGFRHFAWPLKDDGTLVKTEITQGLFAEMSGGSPLVPAKKDYSALFHQWFRLLKDPDTGLVCFCDVISHYNVRHRIDLESLGGVNQITVQVKPASGNVPEVRWVTRMPQYITGVVPYQHTHGLLLLRALDLVKEITPGDKVGQFRYDGISLSPDSPGLLFTFDEHRER